MQREEKQQDAVLEAIISKINDLKNSIAGMIVKVENEYETLNWPTFLDNFALISGQLTTLSKMLSNDKAPILRGLTVLPLLLSPDRDDELARLTEGRLITFAHDVKQVAAMNKVVSHVWEIVSKSREEWETEAGSRAGAAQTSLVADTSILVAAVGMGKGLKPPQAPQGIMGGPPGPQQRGPGSLGPPQGPPQGPMPPQMGPMAKAPSAIKTNIKAAAQVHPYSR
ncbi:hypothetical protein B566_EDAN012716 [Ephemera danica]|nr:hypothetical protein B566_EDAN012716 [Ephemera danica]